jgi:hypothetical protein
MQVAIALKLTKVAPLPPILNVHLPKFRAIYLHNFENHENFFSGKKSVVIKLANSDVLILLDQF